MIAGIGLDLVDPGRFAAPAAQEALSRQCLTAGENDAALLAPDPALCRARIFAGKEAVLKALGSGLEDMTSWRSIEISPALQVRLHGALKAQASRVWLSISVAGRYLVACAMAELG